MRYRVGRITEITGYDLTKPREAWAVQIGLALGRLNPGRGPARGTTIPSGEPLRPVRPVRPMRPAQPAVPTGASPPSALLDDLVSRPTATRDDAASLEDSSKQ